MRILAIRGRNLASLAREFEVDLVGDDLGGSGIFAICGPVGAGKSTLLDALCLALFDRTPRLSGRGGVAVAEAGRPETHWLHSHDPRTLLRRGAGDGHAQVDFTGRDGCRYRATWFVRRARRRVDGRIQAQEMKLEDLDRDVVVAQSIKSEVLGAIRARLGLDFGQFCRSVLLAQGEFAAFLRASADERASLLESLTGADIYRRLSKAAHERRRSEKEKVEKLLTQSETLELLDPEQRQRLDGEAAALAEQVRVNQLAADLAQQVVSWYGTAASHRDDENAATVALQAARDASQAAEPRREHVQALVRSLPLVPHIELVAARQRAVVEAIAVSQRAERDLEAGEQELVGLRNSQRAALARALSTDSEPPPVVVDFPRWRPALARWHRLDTKWRAFGISVEEAGAGVEDAVRKLGAAREQLAAPEFREIGSARRRLVEDRVLVRTQLERLSNWERHAANVQRCRDEVAAREAERERLGVGFEQLVAAQHAADGELREQRRRLEHLRVRGDLAAFGSHLVDGAPCPLCGSPDHPEPAVGDDGAIRAAGAAVEAAEQSRESARNAVLEREAARRECERSLAAARTALVAAEEQVLPARARWLEVAGDFAAASLEQCAIELAGRDAELARQEVELGQLAERHDAAQEEYRRALEAEQRAQQALQSANDLAEAAHELAPGLDSVTGWEDRLRALGSRVVEKLGELADGQARCRAVANANAARLEELTSHRGNAARCDAELQSATDALAQATAAARVSPAAVREAAELGAEAVMAEQESLRELVEAEGRARAVLQKCAEIRRRHESTNRPAIVEDDAAQALEDSREARDAAGKRLEEVRGRLTADNFMTRQRAEIEPRLHAAEAAYELWAALDDLIGHSRGDAFAVFAQGLTLDLLLVEANRRLAELAPRYRLERNHGRDMDFVVVDLDLGGARRGLQSLSGGETFLVSLALALALATLAAPRSRVETLFLDEGFGTLDAHNLEVALGALDSLQAAGCQIGIISHVEGIAERIGTVVDVVPEGSGQSRIRVRTG